jgi:hypothetical protein
MASMAPPVTLVASTFAGPGRAGDFVWMIDRPEWASALFVFNDNEGEWRDHREAGHVPGSCRNGGGNAAIRSWQCRPEPRAIGIPTGTSRDGGYRRLDGHTRAVIDEALGTVATLLATGRYDRLIYSAKPDGSLGHGIFDPADDVRAAIVDGLRALTTG